MTSRTKLIQLVHIGAAKLFPGDEDARRDWQQARTGQRSCASMTVADLENLVAELKRKSALRPPRRAKHPLARKIYALWIDLHRHGVVRDGSRQGLGRWLHRQCGKYSPEWLDTPEAIRAIEALKAWRDREGAA